MRQILQDVFGEAEWRQPSVVLLDDLDKIAGAPTSPEHEHGPEALLQHHVAQSKVFMCATTVACLDTESFGLWLQA